MGRSLGAQTFSIIIVDYLVAVKTTTGMKTDRKTDKRIESFSHPMKTYLLPPCPVVLPATTYSLANHCTRGFVKPLALPGAPTLPYLLIERYTELNLEI